MTQLKQINEILALLEKERGNRHIVVLHEYPDPDAIACGYAQRLIGANFDIETDILYAGEISHQQNLALVRALDTDLIKFDENFDFNPYAGAILVDHQGSTVQKILDRLQAAEIPVLILVDHHELQELVKPVFQDIRKTGANSTIYAQYLEAMGFLDSGQREHVLAATALMNGILTDTGGFVQANAEDLQAAAYLSNYRDAELLSLILDQARSKHVMEIIQRALGNRVLVESFSLAGLGYMRADDRDAIPEVADFLLTEENVHTAIAYGIVRDEEQEETLVGSLRTGKFTLDPDDFIKTVFGTDSQGHFYGGGKVSAGGFSIPIGFLAGNYHDNFSDLKWQVYDEQIKQKVLTKIGADLEQLREQEVV
jgi:nanoRNase/pAp phosphatase (c-di-AMP/oligoRNAs hydrolase)